MKPAVGDLLIEIQHSRNPDWYFQYSRHRRRKLKQRFKRPVLFLGTRIQRSGLDGVAQYEHFFLDADSDVFTVYGIEPDMSDMSFQVVTSIKLCL